MDRVTAVLSVAGIECIESEWNQHDRVLRLYIDRESGIDLDACVLANDLLNEKLGIDDEIPEGGSVEVSSPGIERPLRRIEHFERYIGSQVRVRLRDKVAGRRNAEGRLVGADSSGAVVLELDAGDWKFPIDLLHSASIVYQWQH
jgi:ribosome maturation factor RimP